MPSTTAIAKMLLLMGVTVSGFTKGDGAYYNRVDLRQVCEHRVGCGWQPDLDCDHPCLAAWGLHDPDMLGEQVLAYLPGLGFRA